MKPLAHFICHASLVLDGKYGLNESHHKFDPLYIALWVKLKKHIATMAPHAMLWREFQVGPSLKNTLGKSAFHLQLCQASEVQAALSVHRL